MRIFGQTGLAVGILVLLVSPLCLASTSKIKLPKKAIVQTPQTIDTTKPNKKPLVLTLKDAVFLALRDNPDLQSAELDRINQKYALVVAKNAFQPQYSLTANANYDMSQAQHETATHEMTYSMSPSASLQTKYGTVFTATSSNPATRHGEYVPTLSFSVMQPLIRGFGKAVVEASLQNAFDQEVINRLNMKNTVINTIDTTIKDYLALVQAEESLLVDQNSLKSYNETLKMDEAKLAAGHIAKNDLIKDHSQIAQQKSSIQSEKNGLRQATYILLNDLGLQASANIRLPKNVDLNNLIGRISDKQKLASERECKRLALKNDVSYQSQGYVLKQSETNILTEKDALRPQLNLTATETRGASGSTDGKDTGVQGLLSGRNHSESIGLNLDVPIDKVGERAVLIEARVALEQAKIQYTNLRRQIENGALDSRNNVLNQKEQLRLSREALLLQKKSVEVDRIKLNAGLTSNFELLNEQQTLAAQEQSLISNLIGYVSSIIDFNKKMGSTLKHWGIAIRY